MASPDKKLLMKRKGSFDIVKQDNITPIDGFPRRHSFVPKPPIATFPRRHSEITLPEIQSVQKIESVQRSKQCRRYSLINAPKVLNERPSFKKHSSTATADKKSADDLMQTRIPSAIPEPEVIRKMSAPNAEALATEFSNGSYRPKHCWCLRCQLMYAMFKAGDDRLEMWGNYPCCRR